MEDVNIVVSGGKKAGVTVTMIDLAGEEKWKTGIRLDKLMTKTEEDPTLAFIFLGEENVKKVRYFIDEHIDVTYDTYCRVTYPPGAIFVMWKYMIKPAVSGLSEHHWASYFKNDVDDNCTTCSKKNILFSEKYTCPYCPASLCGQCVTFGICPACKKLDAFHNDMRIPF